LKNYLGSVAAALGLRKKFAKVGAHTLESEGAFAALVEASGELYGCLSMATGELPEVTHRRAGGVRQGGSLIVCMAV
jgi:hypothetical protein